MRLIPWKDRKMPIPRLVMAGLALSSVGCAGWAYASQFGSHSACVGELHAALIVQEYSQVPDRAKFAAERLCNRAKDEANAAMHLIPGARN